MIQNLLVRFAPLPVMGQGVLRVAFITGRIIDLYGRFHTDA
jgi:hypothetical protein